MSVCTCPSNDCPMEEADRLARIRQENLDKYTDEMEAPPIMQKIKSRSIKHLAEGLEIPQELLESEIPTTLYVYKESDATTAQRPS